MSDQPLTTGNELIALLGQGASLTKADIQQAGEQFAEGVLNAGMVSPLEAMIRLRALRDAIDTAVKAIEPAAMTEAERDPKETLLGVSWQVRNGRASYDYSHDAVWAEMKASETAVANQRKAREAFLKSLDREMVDPETGEIVAPAQVKGVSASVLALLYPKS